MKILFKSSFALLFLMFIGSYSIVSGQSYMDRANAEITVSKVIDDLEAVYGQIDSNSDKPFKPNRNAPNTSNRGLDVAKMKYGNIMLKVLRRNQSVEIALNEASAQLVKGNRRDIMLKAQDFYTKLLSL